jgi:fructose-1,6-bisphosphatase/inositol monophosphatase family enzyme
MRRYGLLNAHTIGIAMKEMVRRALGAIRDERFVFEATAKEGYSGKMDDVVTSADKAAQKIYVKLMREMFPTFGIVAEEDALRVPCIDPELGDIYFTVDPLDGTKAYKRRQSHGIGTMVSLVHNGEIIAACIGDVMTQELYYYRPESDHVHRISEFGHAELLTPSTDRGLGELYVLLRQRPEEHASQLLRDLTMSAKHGGAFDGIEVTGGSIGISMARLWKNEVGAAIIGSAHETPWDANPVIGICQKLGFIFLEPDDATGRFVERLPAALKEIFHGGGQRLVIHGSRLSQIEAWLAPRAK